MCGRYEIHSHPAAIALAFGLTEAPELAPRYNIAPSTDVPIVRVAADGARELVRMRWGLVPRWAKDPGIGDRMINARGETIAEKPAFRTAYRRHRCLLPADGFYEWRVLPRADDGPARKQPMHVGMKDGSPFAMGGLYERWRGEDGAVLDTCTIVTTAANEALRPVHDRMPLIIGRDDYERWLDPAVADVADLVVPFPAEAMAYYPVSSRVNRIDQDGPALIEPVAPLAPPDAGPAREPATRPPEQESLF